MEYLSNSQNLWEMTKERQRELLNEAQRLGMLKQIALAAAQPTTNHSPTFVSTILRQGKLLWERVVAEWNKSSANHLRFSSKKNRSF